jgi:hypothetical protein
MKYNFNVSKTGYYQLVSRIAGFNNGSLDFSFNNTHVNVPFQSTNGWQSWQNFYAEIYLEAGEQNMTVTSKSSQFNINYYDLVFVKEAQEIPGKIEAEKYASSAGIETEFCEDDASENLSYVDFGDSAIYPIKVNQSGYYKINVRYASLNDGYFLLNFGNETHHFPFNKTGGWQTWETSAIEVYLDGGDANMTFTGSASLVNINYFEFEFAGMFVTNYISVLDAIDITPMMEINQIKITSPSNLQIDNKIKVFDNKGKLLLTSEEKRTNQQNEYVMDINLPNGNYYISISIRNNEYIKKVVID